eukprot:m.97716 g.97716  ORF g.97716 m.97716 type:complete len:397 (+) comp15539_c1_seq1:159-1349(+)
MRASHNSPAGARSRVVAAARFRPSSQKTPRRTYAQGQTRLSTADSRDMSSSSSVCSDTENADNSRMDESQDGVVVASNVHARDIWLLSTSPSAIGETHSSVKLEMSLPADAESDVAAAAAGSSTVYLACPSERDVVLSGNQQLQHQTPDTSAGNAGAEAALASRYVKNAVDAAVLPHASPAAHRHKHTTTADVGRESPAARVQEQLSWGQCILLRRFATDGHPRVACVSSTYLDSHGQQVAFVFWLEPCWSHIIIREKIAACDACSSCVLMGKVFFCAEHAFGAEEFRLGAPLLTPVALDAIDGVMPFTFNLPQACKRRHRDVAVRQWLKKAAAEQALHNSDAYKRQLKVMKELATLAPGPKSCLPIEPIINSTARIRRQPKPTIELLHAISNRLC